MSSLLSTYDRLDETSHFVERTFLAQEYWAKLGQVTEEGQGLVQVFQAVQADGFLWDEDVLTSTTQENRDLLLSATRRAKQILTSPPLIGALNSLRDFSPTVVTELEAELLRALRVIVEYEAWLILMGAGTDEDLPFARALIPSAASLGLR